MRRPGSEPAEALSSRLRRKVTLLLIAGVSVGATGVILAITVTTLVAEQITGNPSRSGVPVAAAVLGTAAGTSLLSAAMNRWGRRAGLILFYFIAALGALIAFAATLASSYPLLVIGLFVTGVGNSSNALTRYVAADLQSPGRRATTLGWVVWAATVGAVLGPNLLEPTDRIGELLGLPSLAAAYLCAGALFAGSALFYVVFLRPDPSILVHAEVEDGRNPDASQPSRRRLFRLPQVRVAAVALVFGHVVMVLIMTMTPLYLKTAGYGLKAIGLVASAHLVGMFVLAPITGRLVDHFGTMPLIFLGQAILLLSVLGGLLMPPTPALIMTALFLLGLGWNFGYVAGSAGLAQGIQASDRPWLQGRVDSMVWIAAALASLASGLLFTTIGFAGLWMVGGVAVCIALSLISYIRIERRSRVA